MSVFTRTNFIVMRPEHPHKGPAPALPRPFDTDQPEWQQQEWTNLPHARYVFFLNIAAGEQDYDVKVQNTALSLVARGRGLLSFELPRDAVMYNLCLGLTQHDHLIH
jgi:hypothetical protein